MFPSHSKPMRTKEEIEARRVAAEEQLMKTRSERAQNILEQQLTAEQRLRIAKNKEEALEKLKLYKERKAQEASIGSSKIILLPEQKLRIEKNRQEALKKLRLKQQKKVTDGFSTHRKAVPPSKTEIVNSRLIPYSKQIQKSSADSTWGKLRSYKSIECEMEATSDKRFTVKTNLYHKDVVEEFNKIASKAYNPESRIWSFNLGDYEALTKSLTELTTTVKLLPIPPWVLHIVRAETPSVNETCLDCIDPTLLGTLFDYQKEGACYGIARGGRFFLADDMGLGKTFTALAVADFYKDNWPLLIVTTAAMRMVWADTINEYLPSINAQDIRVVESHNTRLANAKVVICSYQGLSVLVKNNVDVRYGVLILDESHEIKNPKAKQTQNALKFADEATRVVCLSGTPALSRPAELFQQLTAIDKNFASHHSFTQRYCEGYKSFFGWNDKGSSNLEELNVILRKKFMIRRTKNKTVELPTKVREKVELKDLQLTINEVEGMRQLSEEYNRLKDNNKEKEKREMLLQWYSETAKAKAEGVARYIENAVKGSEDKYLIFGHHICVLDAISEMLARFQVRNVRIDGSTRPDIRKNNVDSFQNDPNIRCAILSYKACSSGLTLTAASTVIFAELNWNPSIILQAEGRVHRIGQMQQVKSFFLIAPGTSDDIMWDDLQRKQRNLNQIGLVGSDDHFSQNMQLSRFDASTGPSTSCATKSENRITDYYKSPENDYEDDDNDV